MTGKTTVHERDWSGRLAAIGDMVAIMLFLSYGLTTHGVHPLDRPQYTLLTALPFVLPWLVLAPVSGLYRRRTLRSVRSTLVRTTAAWVGVSLLGSVIRSTALFTGGAPTEFVLVVLVFGLGFLLSWRMLLLFAEHVRHNYEVNNEKTGRT